MKTQTDWATSSQFERASEPNKFQDCDDMCNIIDLPDPKGEKSNSPCNHAKDASFNRETLDPIYDTSQFKSSAKILGSKLKKSKFKTKRNSRSKNQRNSSEERKGSKNSSNDSRKNFKPAFNPKKGKIMRPFSGGIQKPPFKLTKSKERPQTAKQSEADLKSPYRKKLLSPTSSKRNYKRGKKKSGRGSKNGNKKTGSSSRNNRKTSLSPSTECENKNIYTKEGGNFGKDKNYLPKFDKEIAINVKNIQYSQRDRDSKIVVIQKFMRGFKEYHITNEKRHEMKLQAMKASASSSNTFKRAISQPDT